MVSFVKDYLEVVFFFVLTLSLYLLYLMTVPLFREPHGLLVMSELSDLTQSGFVLGFLFGSALVCVLLGVLILNWVSILSPGILANLWATTYFFVWIDTIFSLSIRSQSYKFFLSLAIGLAFIYLFFFVLNYLDVNRIKNRPEVPWKKKILYYWIWGWMGFYLGLSGFYGFNSFDNEGLKLPLAAGAMLICFLNYLLIMFFKKSEGKDLAKFSSSGRIFFTVWVLGLTALWLSQRWLF